MRSPAPVSVCSPKFPLTGVNGANSYLPMFAFEQIYHLIPVNSILHALRSLSGHSELYRSETPAYQPQWTATDIYTQLFVEDCLAPVFVVPNMQVKIGKLGPQAH